MRYKELFTLYPRETKAGKTVWYYRTYETDGKRTCGHSTGCTSETKARTFCIKLFSEGSLIPRKTMRFGIYAAPFFKDGCRWIKWKQSQSTSDSPGISPATISAYRKHLENQILPFFEKVPIDKLNTSQTKKWILWMMSESPEKKPWANKTINNALSVFNIICAQAIEENILHELPTRNVGKLRTEKIIRKNLTTAECVQVFSAHWVNRESWVVCLVCCITGMRIGEVMALKAESLFSNYLDVTHSYSSRFGIGPIKNREKRKVPIPRKLFDILVEYKKEGYLFKTSGGIPIAPDKIYTLYMSVLKTLKIDASARGIDLHGFRRFLVSYLRGENVSDAKIRATVGHKDGSMTDLYTTWEPEYLKEVYAAQKKLISLILEKKQNVKP